MTTPLQLFVVGVLMELAYLSFYFVGDSANEVLLFIIVNAFAFLLLTVLLIRTRHATREPQTPRRGRRPNPEPLPFDTRSDPSLALSGLRSGLRTIFAFAILFRLTLVFHSPVASDDIYRYVWDGKVAAHGVNPFLYAPNDSTLASLHTEDLPAKINFPTMRTIYPPLAQVVFCTSNQLFGDSISGLKLLLVFADIITMLLLFQLYKLYRLHQLYKLLFYAWSPLPIMYFGLDGHIDALGIPFLLLFIYFATRNKYFTSAISLGLAGLSKLYPLFVAPFLYCAAEGWKRFALPLIPITMLVVGCWFYWEPTGGLIESFKVFNSEFEFNGSVFHIVYEFVKTNKQAHLVSSILFLTWLGVVFFMKRTILEKTFLAFLGFILFAPVVQPWYLTWLAALLALRWSTAVFVLLGLSNLSNIVVYQYRMSGVWEDSILILFVEYLPFYCLLVWEIVKGKFSARTLNEDLSRQDAKMIF